MTEEKDKQATGQKEARKPWTLKEFGGKSVWDWLQLLIVPLVLVLVGFAFSMQQDARQQAIEDRRAERERELEAQRADHVAVQGYLDQMSTLLLEQDLSDDKLQTRLRARTLTVLEGLDPGRKNEIVQFLVDADLLHSVGDRDPVIELSGADLQGVNLSEADLRGTNLSDATLTDATLTDVTLSDAYLSDAYLNDASLNGANLKDTNPRDVNLNHANLRHAYLRHAYLSGAMLVGANLSGANLNHADLSFADLRNADLSGADLTVVDLDFANLISAEGVTSLELEQEAISLEGATMPDGQKYID